MDLDGIQAGLYITVTVDMEDMEDMEDMVDTVTDIAVTVVGTRDGKLERKDRFAGEMFP